LIDDVPVYPGARNEVAMVACGVAFEHAEGLRILFDATCSTSAVSMLRLQFEALTRAMWLLYAASDLAVEKLTAPLTPESEKMANKLPMVGDMVELIVKKAPPAASQMLVQFKDTSWSAMNSYVHSGIHPLRRHAEGYPPYLILQILRNSNGLNTMTGMLAAILTGDERCIKPMREIHRGFADCLPPLLAQGMIGQ
jgi:hypothetical protein